eukprot:964427-Rhodomonas_salina.1
MLVASCLPSVSRGFVGKSRLQCFRVPQSHFPWTDHDDQARPTSSANSIVTGSLPGTLTVTGMPWPVQPPPRRIVISGWVTDP